MSLFFPLLIIHEGRRFMSSPMFVVLAKLKQPKIDLEKSRSRFGFCSFIEQAKEPEDEGNT